ncbi:MAG: cache domain-containing protein, partial [Pseudomonadota bacterium]
EVFLEFLYRDEPQARSSLDDLLAPAVPDAEFDHLLLTRADGEVLFSRGAKGIEIIDLPAPRSAGTGEAVPATAMTAVTSTSIAGKDFKVFSQPMALPIPVRWRDVASEEGSCADGETPTTDPGPNRRDASCETLTAEVLWHLTGLKDPGDFRAEAMAISPSVVLVTFALAVAALLSLPYLKLRFLGRREALRAHDVLVQFIALLVGATIGTFAILEIYARSAENSQIGRRLSQLNADISSAFLAEVACLDAQLRSLNRADPERPPELTRLLDESAAAPVDLSHYAPLEMVYWMNASGQQTHKWTVKDERTTFLNVSNRDYFRNAREGRFFPPRSSRDPTSPVACASADAAAVSAPGQHTLQSIRTRTTGAITAVLSQRSIDESGTIGAVAMLAPLRSLITPTIPPGFSFAVIRRDGTVLFHSDPTRILRENFLDELGDAKELKAEIWSQGPGVESREIRINYRAQTHRAKLLALDGTPWTLVSMYDVSAYRVARAEVLTFSAAISLLYTATLLAVFALLHQICSHRASDRGTIFHRLWPCPEKQTAYLGILAVSCIAILIWLLVTLVLNAQAAVAAAALLGVLTFAIAFITLYQADDSERGPGPVARLGALLLAVKPDQSPVPGEDSLLEEIREAHDPGLLRRYTASIVAVVLMISVFPPISFFRAANDEIMTLFVMRDQLYLAEDLRHRTEQIEERYRRISMSDGNRARIETLYQPESGCIGDAADVHTAQWNVSQRRGTDHSARPCREEGTRGNPAEDRALSQPLVAWLGPYLLGFVDESWELRAIARDSTGPWRRRGERLEYAGPGLKLPPRLAGETRQWPVRGAGEPDAETLVITAPWPGLAVPSPLSPNTWLAILLAAIGMVMIWTLIRSLARLVFLADLKRPYFLPVRAWSDIEQYPRTLVLRGELDGEPRDESETLLRIDSARSMDLTPIVKLEKSGLRAKESTVIIDNFHTGLWNPETAENKLKLLERLLAIDCRIVIHSEVNPLHYLTMLSGDYVRGIASTLPDLGRWSAALASFTRCREVLHEETTRSELTKRLLEIHGEAVGKGPVTGAAATALRTLAGECWPDLELHRIAEKLASRPDLATLLQDDEDYLINQVLDLSEARYRMLWSISGKDERMVLYRLASNGFASWRSHELVRRLLHRGLLCADPSPRLMNQSFRRFVLDAELPEVFEQWTQEDGASAWVRLRTPMVVSLIGVFLFLFTTQPQLFSQSLAFTTALAAILPTLIKVISVVAGSQKGSSD